MAQDGHGRIRCSLLGFSGLLLAGLIVAALLPRDMISVQAQQKTAPPIATGARLGGDSVRTRFILDLSHAIGFNVFVLADPFRIIIDSSDINFQLPPGLGRTGRGLISAYRYGRFTQGQSRIVLDANAPVLIDKSYSLKSVNGLPARLVIDLVRTDRKTFLQRQALIKKRRKAKQPKKTVRKPVSKPKNKNALSKKIKHALRPAIKPKPRPKARPKSLTIVIDPGHGGVDPGAIGHEGTMEKTIVLAFAKSLRRALMKTGRYNVVMTRRSDRFMRLRQRVEKARKLKANLFIALHADSLNNASVRGATVYTLSETASDREAAALAAKENRADIIAGVDLVTESSEVTGILIDLAQRETKNHSVVLAKHMVASMKRVTKLTTNPHRFAGFRVLTAPDVPSLLIELGYLSSRADERLLKSDKWHRKTAAAITHAVNKYFRARLAEGNL